MQSLAFEALSAARGNPADPALRLDMLCRLARAAGSAGMVGGQAIDLGSVGRQLDQAALEVMHRHKTGALIEASVHLGALASGRATPGQLAALREYAQAIGLAFQVQDDILDVESDTATLGKTQGKDEANDKPTYPALLGLAGAKAYARPVARSGAGRARRLRWRRRAAAPVGALHRRTAQLRHAGRRRPPRTPST